MVCARAEALADRRGASRLAGSTMPIIGTKASPVATADRPLILLEVEAEHEDQAVEGDVDEEADQRGQREHADDGTTTAAASAARVRALAPDEQSGQDRGRREADKHERMLPAERAALDDGAGQRAERADRGELARQIDLALREPRRLLGIAPGEPEAGERRSAG